MFSAGLGTLNLGALSNLIILILFFKDEAFDIGEDIAKVITEMNPKPMKLKFEKVICNFTKRNS